MKMFKPRLVLKPDFNGTHYSMRASVFTPNGCYLAAGTDPNWPKGMVGIPEAQPMQLFVQKHGEICTMAIKNLKFYSDGLSCDGKTFMVAHTMFEGNIVGTSTSALPCFDAKDLRKHAGAPPAAGKGTGVIVDAVEATIDARPGTKPDLFVAISVVAPTTGFTYKAEDLGPFGFTGRTLLLRLHAKSPQLGGDAMTPEIVQFHSEVDSPDKFDSVAVLHEGNLYFDTIEVLH